MSKAELTATLVECERLLSHVGEEHWAEKIRQVVQAQDIREYEINEIQFWFGGMRSFNDLILCSMNGHNFDAADEIDVNSRFQSLKNSIYEISREAQREFMLNP